MNTLVNFELAKLLKEKGYNNSTRDCYNVHGLLFSNGWCEYIEDDFEFDGLVKANKLRKEDTLAPTIVEVVMWLYEKHKIWISVGGDCDYKFRFEIHKWNWYELEKTYRLGHVMLGESLWDTTSNHFNSPTEAYEAAIGYTLNKLI